MGTKPCPSQLPTSSMLLGSGSVQRPHSRGAVKLNPKGRPVAAHMVPSRTCPLQGAPTMAMAMGETDPDPQSDSLRVCRASSAHPHCLLGPGAGQGPRLPFQAGKTKALPDQGPDQGCAASRGRGRSQPWFPLPAPLSPKQTNDNNRDSSQLSLCALHRLHR